MAGQAGRSTNLKSQGLQRMERQLEGQSAVSPSALSWKQGFEEAGGRGNAWIAVGVKSFSTLQALQPPGSKRQLAGRGLMGFLWLQAPPQLTQARRRCCLVDWPLTTHLSTWTRRMLAITEDVKCRLVAPSVESIRHEESMILPSVYGWLSLKYPF